MAILGCGPLPRTVTVPPAASWPMSLGNVRRAPYEHEGVPASLTVAWDVKAGSGLRTSVLLTDSVLFAGTSNRELIAFSTTTGQKFWGQRVEGEISGDIVLSGRTLFLTTAEWNGRVHARDVARGRRIWRSRTGPAKYGPVVAGNVVFVATDNGVVRALRSGDGSEIWQARISGSPSASMLSAGDAVFVPTTLDTLYRLSARDGAITAKTALASTISAAPAFAMGEVVAVNFAGDVIAFDATSLAQRWRIQTGKRILAAPVITSDGVIHVMNRDAVIWQIAAGQGRRITSLGGAVTTSFTVARARYVVGTIDGRVVITDLHGRRIVEHKFNDSVGAPIAVRDRALYVPLLRGRIVKLQ